jgi:hypothetical protein
LRALNSSLAASGDTTVPTMLGPYRPYFAWLAAWRSASMGLPGSGSSTNPKPEVMSPAERPARPAAAQARRHLADIELAVAGQDYYRSDNDPTSSIPESQ